MKLVRMTSLSSLTAMAVVLSGLLVSSQAKAQSASISTVAYEAFNSGFLVQGNGQACYTHKLATVSTSCEATWEGADDIEMAEDYYTYTHDPATRSLIVTLLNTFLVNNNTDWSYDDWNDDIAWMTNAFLRGYQITGQANFLTQAEYGWNLAYNRGWDSSLGGGIWENQGKPGKESLSNNPFVFEAVQLYQLSGDSTYLTKAQAIYDWVRTNLVNTTNSTNSKGAPGQVNQGIKADGSLNVADNVYNEGLFINAANDLYRITGTQMYHDDALLAITHRVNLGAVLHNSSEGGGSQWQYWFTRGVGDFATQNGAWGTYLSWMQGNANAAWNERCSLNLTWNDWTNPTNPSGTDGAEMESAAEIWQNLPQPAISLSGTWEIQNVNSGLALNVKAASKIAGAIVVQYPFMSGQTNSLWTFVPTSGGFYQIKNVNSGLVLNVSGGVTTNALNGALIDQTDPAGMTPGNQQWVPVKNSDGTYSFYSLNSQQALDVPGASTTSDVQLDQWFGNSTTAQKFKLIAR
jgi:predicted alpha-1,6-mannanase (GH76 family)